jgi:hypothetical protein
MADTGGSSLVDLAVHVWLVDRRGHYLLTHPIDVLMVLLPGLRPLRVLRVFTAGQALVTRGGRMSLLRSTQAIATAAAGSWFSSPRWPSWMPSGTRQAPTSPTWPTRSGGPPPR